MERQKEEESTLIKVKLAILDKIAKGVGQWTVKPFHIQFFGLYEVGLVPLTLDMRGSTVFSLQGVLLF